LWRQLAKAVRELNDQGAHAIVLGTTGPSFFSGGDLAELRSLDRREQLEYLDDVETTVCALEDSTAPVVARVSGRCVGAGFVVASACSRVVASQEASFAMPAAKAGIFTDARQIKRLVDSLGTRLARSMLTGRRLDASIAAAIGVIDELCEPDELEAAAAATAGHLATLERSSVAHIRDVLAALRDGPDLRRFLRPPLDSDG
jgi:enoyl-CoA hydratase/carnithine racemase